MLDLTALDVVIGLGFVYLSFSLVVSRINETVAALLEWRAKALESALHQLLTGEPKPGKRDRNAKTPARLSGSSGVMTAEQAEANAVLSRLLELSRFNHPLITHMQPRKVFSATTRRPSYIAPQTFSLALLDILVPNRQPNVEAVRLTDRIRARVNALSGPLKERLLDLLPPEGAVLPLANRAKFRDLIDAERRLRGEQKDALRDLLSQLDSMPEDPLTEAAKVMRNLPKPVAEPLTALLVDAADDLERFRTNIERWFDDAMGRVSGYYTRKVHIWLVVYAIAVVLLLNIDSVTIARRLWADDVLRAAIVAVADRPDQEMPEVPAVLDQIKQLQLPLGWSSDDPLVATPDNVPKWLLKVLGLSISVLALSLGAPFWFDVLGKISRLRMTGPPPASSEARAPPK